MTQQYCREASYESYEIDLSKVYYGKIIGAVRRFSQDPHGKLLDIGCFDGTLACQFMAEREVYGIEGNIKACKRANEKGVKAFAVDLEKGLPFENEMFDSIIAAEIIEHIYDTDFFLQEIHRILKPQGILVMSIPNLACFANRVKLLFGGYPRYAEYKAGGAGHIRVYTAPIIRKQLTENNFHVIYLAGCNLPLPMHNPYIPRWIKKIAATVGEYFPTISGQVILAGRKKS